MLVTIHQVEDSKAAVTYHFRVGGQVQHFCNKNFSDWFMTTEEMSCRMDRYGIIPALVWPSVLDWQEDMSELCYKLLQVTVSPPTSGMKKALVAKVS